MKKPLAYYKKFPGDEHRCGIVNCSLEAHGLRERLTMLAHDCEPYGFLPLSIDLIAKRCGLEDTRRRRAFDQILKELLGAGVVLQNEHGILYIPELVLQAQEREKERLKKFNQRHPEDSFPLLDRTTPQYSAVPAPSAVSAVSAAPVTATSAVSAAPAGSAVSAVLRQTPSVKSLGTVISAVTPQSPIDLRKKFCPPDVPTSSPSASVSTSAVQRQPRYRSNGGSQKLRSKTETTELEWRAVEHLLEREGWNKSEIGGVMPHIRERCGDPPMDLELYRQLAFCLRARNKNRKPVYVWTCKEMPADIELRHARIEFEKAIGAVAAQKIPTVAAPV